MGDEDVPSDMTQEYVNGTGRDGVSMGKQQAQHWQQQQQQQQQQQHQRIPFHAQIDSFANNDSQPYNMTAFARALPTTGPSPTHQIHFDPGSTYQAIHPLQYAPRGVPIYFDPMAMRAQQQHQQLHHFYNSGYSARLYNVPAQDMFRYGAGHVPQQHGEFQYAAHAGITTPLSIPGPGAVYSRRVSDPAQVPSFPRGPPRKPKQSGHALWVGNLPAAATVIDLKDHFSRDARDEIESVFLISKSNCAFVNYRSEAACTSAKNRFHDSSFHGVRLVCRLRRGSTSAASTPTIPEMLQTPTTTSFDNPNGATAVRDDDEPVIVGHTQKEGPSDDDSETVLNHPTDESSTKVPAKYFIVKSLTVEDLEASVRNRTWATQSHNEEALSNAFDRTENVFLIFSANKSGEYFGYARMVSQISGEPISLGTLVESAESGTPQSIPTPATDTAPRGRIIDDSARGTIFWEADPLDSEDEEERIAVEKEGAEDEGGKSGQNWGRQFKIEWMSTARLPFFRTRGLRNPWNANREIKIARDGTELEPSIGLRLVQMFHRPAGSAPSGAAHN